MTVETPPCADCGAPSTHRSISLDGVPHVAALCVDCLLTYDMYECQSVLQDPGMPERCDFCSEVPPAWEFPCADFKIESEDPRGPVHNMSGGWLACDSCKPLVEDEAWDLLKIRIIQKHKEIHDLNPSANSLRNVAILWVEFTKYRTGEPWPLSSPSTH